MPVSLHCTACGKSDRRDEVVTGSAPACSACGGKLALPAPAVFRCASCGVASKPVLLDLATVRPCPRCKAPLSVAPDAQAATITLGTIEAGAAADTLAAHGPTSMATVQLGDVDPAKARFIGGSPQPAAQPRGGLKSGKFGRYEILRELARGGMGIVYKANDPALRRVVALKVMIAGEGADDNQIRRFIREARAASALRHPNIVTVHDTGEIDGQHFFTMDFIEGRELAAVIEAGKEGRERMVGWIRDVCGALHHAHEKGIIHRDLKPANIMIDREDRPLVMDFGLARDQGSQSIQSLSGSVCGTPAYMSPEQARGKVHDLDRRSDIYSMGILLYELSTHRKPFSGNTLFDTMRAVIHDDPRPPLALDPKLGADLNTIILKCLEKDPQRRYQTMQELAGDLDHWLKREPIAARPVSGLERLVRRVRREPKLLATVIAAPIACAIGLTAALLLMGDGFLPRMEIEARSGDPARIASAATSVAGQIHDHRFAKANRERALALLRSVVGGPSPEAEERAIAALVAERDAGAAPALLELAGGKDLAEPRRRRAFAALRDLVEVLPDKPAAARVMADAVSRADASPAVVAIAGEVMVACDGERAREAMTAIATDRRRASEVRVAAIGNLGSHLFLASPAMQTLLSLQADRDRAVADAAEKTLVKARSGAEVLTLYGLSSGKAVDAQVGKMLRAVDAQQRLAKEIAEEDDDSSKPAAKSPVEAMAERLRAGDAGVRCAAAYDLGQLHDAAAITPLTTAIADADGAVRRSAGRALVKLSPLGTVPTEPVAAALRYADPRVREHAAVLAGELEARELVPALGEGVRSEKDDTAAAAMAEALGRIGDPAALPALGDGCRRGPETALACIAALRARKAFAGKALPLLADALSSTSRGVREAALQALRDATGQDHGTDAASWKASIADPAK